MKRSLLRSLLILAAVTLSACSDDDDGPTVDSGSSPDGTTIVDSATTDGPLGTCTATSCAAPFTCQANDGGTKGCRSAAGDVPACSGTPDGQLVPFALVPETSIPTHWAVAPGCLATSYHPDLGTQATQIAAAVKAFSDVICSALCLEPPIETAAVPELARAERRIHFRVGDSNVTRARTTVLFENTTGRILTVTVDIEPGEQDNIAAHEWLQLVGYAVGLSAAAQGVNSVMAPSPATSVTSNDEQALCKLYGSPSYCGD
jgi:hypothetical protein